MVRGRYGAHGYAGVVHCSGSRVQSCHLSSSPPCHWRLTVAGLARSCQLASALNTWCWCWDARSRSLYYRRDAVYPDRLKCWVFFIRLKCWIFSPLFHGLHWKATALIASSELGTRSSSCTDAHAGKGNAKGSSTMEMVRAKEDWSIWTAFELMLLLMMNDYKPCGISTSKEQIFLHISVAAFWKKNLASISISESWVLKSHHLYVSVHGEFLSAFVWLHVGKLCIR